MSIKIYQTFHKQFPYTKCDWIQPVGVNGYYETGFVQDSTGDNIAHLNPYYAEFTSWYWAWRNDCDYDIIGFYHYRRYLHMAQHDYNFVWDGKIDKGSHYQIDWMDNPHMLDQVASNEYKNLIIDCLDSTEVISGYPMRFATTLPQQWADCHPMDPWYVFVEEVKRQYSHESESNIDEYFRDFGQIIWPILIFRGRTFRRLCSELFPILNRVFARIGTPYDHYQNRYLCFIVERFLPFWFLKERIVTKTFPTITFFDYDKNWLHDRQGKKSNKSVAFVKPGF